MHEDDSRASKQHLDLWFWNPGPHMACMGRGSLHCVSDIRGGHSPASSPPGGEIQPLVPLYSPMGYPVGNAVPSPLGGDFPPRSSFPRVSPLPEGLPRLGFVLQWPLVPMYMPAKWGAHPFMKLHGLGVKPSLCWGKALPTLYPMTHTTLQN